MDIEPLAGGSPACPTVSSKQTKTLPAAPTGTLFTDISAWVRHILFMSLPRHIARLFAPLRASSASFNAVRSAVSSIRPIAALTSARALTSPAAAAARRFSSAASSSPSSSSAAVSSAPALLSYAHGTSAVPLLGTTIGAQFDTTVAAHGDALALVSRAQVTEPTALKQ